MDEKYTLESTLRTILQEQKIKDFMERIAPGMTNNPMMSFLSDTGVGVLITSVPDKAAIFQAMLDVANGKDVEMEIPDLSKTLPVIRGGSEFTYNIDDVDGQMYMVEHHFSGCFVLRFSKEMDESVYGRVTCGGVALPKGLIKKIEAAGGIQMFGVPVRELFRCYDTEYVLCIEGFKDTDGHVMAPQEIKVRTLPKPLIDPAYAEHDHVALNAACEGIVLLKNKGGLLPLPETAEIRVYGARDFRLGAVGAGKINPRYYMNLTRALEECGSFKLRDSADAAVVVISRASSENYDNNAVKGEFYLSDDEEALFKALSGQGKKIIAVINSGYPMDVRWIETYNVNAALWCGFPGMLGGKAAVEILDGRVNPSGKLPDTWSLDYYDIPASANFYLPPNEEEALSADSPLFVDTCYEEDIYVGYRYFETFNKPVAYPFGFGLSYTTFKIEAAYDHLVFTVSVTNTGNRTGKEVVQLYVEIPDGKLEQPSKRLVGFAKTKLLQPNEMQQITITMDKADLASFDTDTASWVLEAGEYKFYCGNAVSNLALCGSSKVEKGIVIKQSENYLKLPIEMEVLSKKDPALPKGEKSGIKRTYTQITPKQKRKHFPASNRESGDLAARLSVKDLVRLSVCASHGWGMHQTGEAGRVFKLTHVDLPDFIVADGNNGLNIKKPNIGMPCSNTVCATWNTEIAYEVGRVIAEEAKENGINLILAPAMNIHRNPLNGRHPEYFSEDPYLAGIMAGNHLKGLEENGVSGSVKHIAANNCEASRKRNHSFITERALREIYLKAYETAFSIHKPDSIMTAYNALNGCFCAEDEELLQGIFRNELGFDGFVMTDWNSYDTVDIVSAVSAGNCWLTPGTIDDKYVAPLVEGVEIGRIDESRLRENVRGLLKIILKRGR